jgi:hypothetical protein
LVVLRNTNLGYSAYEAAAIGWGLLTAPSRLVAAAVLNQPLLVQVIARYTLVSTVGSSNSLSDTALNPCDVYQQSRLCSLLRTLNTELL